MAAAEAIRQNFQTFHITSKRVKMTSGRSNSDTARAVPRGPALLPGDPETKTAAPGTRRSLDLPRRGESLSRVAEFDGAIGQEERGVGCWIP